MSGGDVVWFLIRSAISKARANRRRRFLLKALERAHDLADKEFIKIRLVALDRLWFRDYLCYCKESDRELAISWREILIYGL